MSFGRANRESGPDLSLARLVWYETIHQHEKHYEGEPPTSVYFHKISTLTHFRLKDQGVPFHFPYSWYLFGTEAEATGRDVDFVPDDTGERTLALWAQEEPEQYQGDKVADAIRKTTRDLLEKYPDEAIERVIDEVYTYAPYEFQRRYRLVRIALEVTGRGSMYQQIAHSTDLMNLLSDAGREFPRERFPILVPYVSPLREAVERAWSSTLSRDYGVVRELVESFWTAFSAYLRVDERGHFGVPRSQLEDWADFAQVKLELFTRTFGDVVVDLGEKYGNVEADGILGPILTKRRADRAREKALIDDAVPYLEGLDATLARLYPQSGG